VGQILRVIWTVFVGRREYTPTHYRAYQLDKFNDMGYNVSWVHLSIFSSNRPGPRQARSRTLLNGREQRSWSPRKNFWARAQSEMVFLVVLHYKIRRRLAQAQARPEPGPKTEAWQVPWDGHGRDFLTLKKSGFFRPNRNLPRSAKCSGLLIR
jgi:hypothetical protein